MFGKFMGGVQMKDYYKVIDDVIKNINSVIVGKEDTVEKIILAVLTGNHVLIEDVPGVGKTTLINAVAKTIGCTFSRIQFTPDLLPSDITGITVYNMKEGSFEFRQGPVMANIVLADEINRSSPKTQSSLLEAMQEKHLTIDGNTYELPNPFIVLATQNPIEYEGTFPLPEAQLDRFSMKLSLGYPDFNEEKEILRRFGILNQIVKVQEIISAEDIIKIKDSFIDKIFIDDCIINYILQIVQATRNHSDIYLGASPRGSLYIHSLAKALAFIKGREYVIPDDVRRLIVPTLSHRIILKPEARIKGKSSEQLLKEITDSIRVPLVKKNA